MSLSWTVVWTIVYLAFGIVAARGTYHYAVASPRWKDDPAWLRFGQVAIVIPLWLPIAATVFLKLLIERRSGRP